MDARVTASQRRKGTRKADGIDQSLYKRAGLPGPFREFDTCICDRIFCSDCLFRIPGSSLVHSSKSSHYKKLFLRAPPNWLTTLENF
jgi:hypothetical protein